MNKINRKRITEEFCSLVEIDALSYQERNIADVLKKKLGELGFQVREDDAGTHYNGSAGNVYGFLEGELEGPPLLFSAHMDTVNPGKNKKAVVHKDGTITSQGNTVLGADDLSGIVTILEAVRLIRETGLSHRSIEVLFTIAEEVYIRGSEVFDYSLLQSKEAYVLDLSGAVGTAALAAPTLISFTATIHGKSSHAGFAPELGINAIAITAQIISGLKQGRIDEDTTVNIGLIEGGKAGNIVPDCCSIKGEVRSMTQEKAQLEINHIEQDLKKITAQYGAVYKFNTELGCLAYDIEKNHPVVTRFEHACKKLGYDTNYTKTFGGSDNNNLVRHGINGIVIASGMNQVHSCEEYTHIDELVKSCNIVIELLTGKD